MSGDVLQRLNEYCQANGCVKNFKFEHAWASDGVKVWSATLLFVGQKPGICDAAYFTGTGHSKDEAKRDAATAFFKSRPRTAEEEELMHLRAENDELRSLLAQHNRAHKAN